MLCCGLPYTFGMPSPDARVNGPQAAQRFTFRITIIPRVRVDERDDPRDGFHRIRRWPCQPTGVDDGFTKGLP